MATSSWMAATSTTCLAMSWQDRYYEDLERKQSMNFNPFLRVLRTASTSWPLTSLPWTTETSPTTETISQVRDTLLKVSNDFSKRVLPGWWLLWKRLNPFGSEIKIPGQSEIQMRLAFCSHYKNLEELKSNPNYEYIQPPIGNYDSGAVSVAI